MKLLHIDSSALGTGSVTRELSAAIVARWQDKLPHLEVTYRDLDADPLPHLSARSLAQSDPRRRPMRPVPWPSSSLPTYW